MLGTLALVGHNEHQPQHRPILPLFVVILTGAVLVYGTLDIPPFGDASNPAHHHVAPHYLEESEHEIGIPNVVTSVLASYRGYDTMGETTVIFAALVGVLLLLSLGPRPGRLASNGRATTIRDRDKPASEEGMEEAQGDTLQVSDEENTLGDTNG